MENKIICFLFVSFVFLLISYEQKLGSSNSGTGDRQVVHLNNFGTVLPSYDAAQDTVLFSFIEQLKSMDSLLLN